MRLKFYHLLTFKSARINSMSLVFLLIFGLIPTLIFAFLSKEKINFSALLMTWAYLFGWAMFMEFAYFEMNIWYWVPESSIGYFLARPIEDMLFATFLITTPVVFYYWTLSFFKKEILLGKKTGLIFLISTVFLLLIFEILQVPTYTKYLPIFSLFVAGLLLVNIPQIKIKPLSVLSTTTTVLLFSFIWNNLAITHNIWGWNQEAVGLFILGMPIDEIFFVFFMIPGIIIIQQIFDDLLKRSNNK